MNATLALAVGMVRSWVALYTLGLPEKLREARRLEIDCDLWEQRQLAEYTSEQPLGTAAEIAVRTVLGMISDITWRVEAGLSARRNRSIEMHGSLTMRGLFVLALAIAIAPAGFGIGIWAGSGSGISEAERVVFGILLFVVAAAMAGGLLLSTRNPRLGIALVALGAIGLSVMWFWIAFVTVPIGAALVFLAYWRARGTGWPSGAGTA